MTTAEFRAHLKRLRLSQQGFARLTRTNERTVRRWANAGQDIPDPIASLLERLGPEDVRQRRTI